MCYKFLILIVVYDVNILLIVLTTQRDGFDKILAVFVAVEKISTHPEEIKQS